MFSWKIQLISDRCRIRSRKAVSVPGLNRVGVHRGRYALHCVCFAIALGVVFRSEAAQRRTEEFDSVDYSIEFQMIKNGNCGGAFSELVKRAVSGDLFALKVVFALFFFDVLHSNGEMVGGYSLLNILLIHSAAVEEDRGLAWIPRNKEIKYAAEAIFRLDPGYQARWGKDGCFVNNSSSQCLSYAVNAGIVPNLGQSLHLMSGLRSNSDAVTCGTRENMGEKK